jgi:hypothetical protein
LVNSFITDIRKCLFLLLNDLHSYSGLIRTKLRTTVFRALQFTLLKPIFLSPILVIYYNICYFNHGDWFRDNAGKIAASAVNASFSCFLQLLAANAIPVPKYVTAVFFLPCSVYFHTVISYI